MKEHNCGRDETDLPELPDRAIWIEAANPTRIRLFEPKGARAKYIALSYCWGPVSSETFLTDASTFEARKAGIRPEELPPLFQDVVRCARELGIEYIWIDRLCIIQGDANDFKIQAPKMGEIYGNATLTISAASATTENDRILVERESKWLSSERNLNLGEAESLRCRRRSHPLGKEKTGGDYGRVSTRAWIWQERLLSARTVFYTPSGLKFECHRHSIWEGFAKGVTGHSWSGQLDNAISQLSWMELVEDYMRRDISRPSDRLPAINSVMGRIARRQGWVPLWGIWADAIVEGLTWEAKQSASLEETASLCVMNTDYYAPSWSWASVNGPISYTAAKPTPLLKDVYDLEVEDFDDSSGLITLTGRAIYVEMRCVSSWVNPAGDSSQDKSFRYRYEVLHLHEIGPFLIKADVPLKPWSGIVNGREAATVIRVPYGETPPDKPWKAKCICLLVHKAMRTCQVLFLCHSLRKPGAFERIGTTSGLDPVIFATSEKSTIRIA